MRSFNPSNPPDLSVLEHYNVNRAKQVEVIWQPKYDYQTYAAAGTTKITFFQSTVGTGGTTLADTNMEASGQVPSPKAQLVTGIQVFFDAGNAVAQATAAATAQENWNDVTDVLLGSAYLNFFVGSKDYLTDAPLAKFAQQFCVGGTADSAYTGTNATPLGTIVDYAVGRGRYYAITPVKLPSNQNFNVSLNFPTAIAINTDARIGVILDGFEYRLSQ